MYKNVRAFDISFVVIEPRVRLQVSNYSARHRRGSVGNDIDFAKLRSSLVKQSLDVRFRGDVLSDSEDFCGAADGLDCSGRFFEQRGLATGKDDSLRAGLGPGSEDLLKDPLVVDLHIEEHTPPRPPPAPVIRTVLPVVFNAGFIESIAEYMSRRRLLVS